MEETYTVCGDLQVAGKLRGDTLTQADLDEARLSEENVASLVSAGLIEKTKSQAKSTTAKNKTGE